MLTLAILVELCLAGAALLLWARLTRIRRALIGVGRDVPELRPLAERLASRSDETMLPRVDHTLLASLPVPCREPADDYRTVAELLQDLRGLPRRNDLPALQARLKACYQLADALTSAPEDLRDLDSLLEPLTAAASGQDFLGNRVRQLQLVPAGAPIDRSTMLPVGTGGRVRLPLGGVLRGQEGEVLCKAKVLCG